MPLQSSFTKGAPRPAGSRSDFRKRRFQRRAAETACTYGRRASKEPVSAWEKSHVDDGQDQRAVTMTSQDWSFFNPDLHRKFARLVENVMKELGNDESELWLVGHIEKNIAFYNSQK